MRTVKLPERFELQEKDAVPEPAMLLGIMLVHASPVGTLSVSWTIPENPLFPVTVMVDCVDCPTGMDDGLATVSAKSGADVPGTRTIVWVEWSSGPLVPVNVTV